MVHTILNDAALLVTSLIFLPVCTMEQAESLCSPLWHFHGHTGTCIRVFRDAARYRDAKAACARFKGGTHRNVPGWLAGIHDRETDMFVRSLLRRGDEAYIGLTHGRGVYRWEDKTPYSPSAYSGIRHSRFVRHGYMIVSPTGWRGISIDTRRSFVCQMRATMPNVSMSCAPMQEGLTFPPLTCHVPLVEQMGSFSSLTVWNSNFKPLVTCFSDADCYASRRDFAAQTSIDHTRKRITGTVKGLRNAAREDDRVTWYCAIGFGNIDRRALTTSCEMRVFAVPEVPTCSWNAPNNTIVIACEARGAYPAPTLTWRHAIDSRESSGGKSSWNQTTYSQGRWIFYRSRLEYSVENTTKTKEGNHRFEVSVSPNFLSMSAAAIRNATQTGEIEFNISAPSQPPSFFIGSGTDALQGKLTAREGQPMLFRCDVDGGSPSVSETIIMCEPWNLRALAILRCRTVQTRGDSNSEICEGAPDEKISWNSPNKSVEVELVASRLMDQKQCNCTARHASQAYKMFSAITLDILYPAALQSFTVNGESFDKIEVALGETVTMNCSAVGNPKPTLHIVQSYSDGKPQRTVVLKENAESVTSSRLASCTMSGIYLCLALSGQLRGQAIEVDQRFARVKVVCRSRPCNRRQHNPRFSALPGAEVVVKICVYAYPPIKSLVLSKNRSSVAMETYSAEVKDVQPNEAKQTIHVRINGSETPYGHYEIFAVQDSYRKLRLTTHVLFSLVPPEKPSCPESLDVINVGSSFAILSWEPASDLGLNQTFVLTRINADGVMVKETIEDDGEVQVTHNVTDLRPRSSHRLNMSVVNSVGLTVCPALTVNVTIPDGTTSTSPTQVGSSVRHKRILKAAVKLPIAIIVLIILFIIMSKSKGVPPNRAATQQHSESDTGINDTYSDEQLEPPPPIPIRQIYR